MKIRVNIPPEKNLTSGQFAVLKRTISQAIALEVYRLAVEQAAYRLHTSYVPYTEALSVDEVETNVFGVKLSGSKLASMIEGGASAFDIKAGFKLSNKVKYTKSGGWYLTIPMIFKTPSVSVHSIEPGQVMPRKIYDLIRQQPVIKENEEEEISRLGADKIPAKYDPITKVIPELFQIGNVLQTYTHKSSIYAGMQRTRNKITGMSSYNTFRRVSDNSDNNSWLHPGIRAMNILDDAERLLDSERIVDEILKKSL